MTNYSIAAALRLESARAIPDWLDDPLRAPESWPDWPVAYQGWRFKTLQPVGFPTPAGGTVRDGFRAARDASHACWYHASDDQVWIWADCAADDRSPDRVHAWAERWFAVLRMAERRASGLQTVHYWAAEDIDPATILAVAVIAPPHSEFVDAGGLAEYGLNWQSGMHDALDPLALWRDAARDAGKAALTDPRFRADEAFDL